LAILAPFQERRWILPQRSFRFSDTVYPADAERLALRDYPVVVVVENSPHQRGPLSLRGFERFFQEQMGIGVEIFHLDVKFDRDRIGSDSKPFDKMRAAIRRTETTYRTGKKKACVIVIHSADLADKFLKAITGKQAGATSSAAGKRPRNIDVLLTDLMMPYEPTDDVTYLINAVDRARGQQIDVGLWLAARASEGGIPCGIYSTEYHHDSRGSRLAGRMRASETYGFGSGVGSGMIILYSTFHIRVKTDYRGRECEIRYVERCGKICRIEPTSKTPTRVWVKQKFKVIRDKFLKLLNYNPSPAVRQGASSGRVSWSDYFHRLGWKIRAYVPFHDYWAGDLTMVKVFDLESGEYLGTYLSRDCEHIKDFFEAFEARLEMPVTICTG